MGMIEAWNQQGSNKNTTTELEKATPFMIAQIIEHEHNSVVSRPVMKKDPGSINIMAFDKGKELRERLLRSTLLRTYRRRF